MLNGLRRAGRSAFIKIRCLFRLRETVEAAEIAAIGDTDAQVTNLPAMRINQSCHGLILHRDWSERNRITPPMRSEPVVPPAAPGLEQQAFLEPSRFPERFQPQAQSLCH